MEALAVEGDDAGGLLAAVLERVQAERGDGGGVGMAEDAEHAAFFAQAVEVGIGRVEVGWLGHHVVPHRFVASINWRMSVRSDRG